jgi:hypothetical protein
MRVRAHIEKRKKMGSMLEGQIKKLERIAAYHAQELRGNTSRVASSSNVVVTDAVVASCTTTINKCTGYIEVVADCIERNEVKIKEEEEKFSQLECDDVQRAAVAEWDRRDDLDAQYMAIFHNWNV